MIFRRNGYNLLVNTFVVYFDKNVVYSFSPAYLLRVLPYNMQHIRSVIFIHVPMYGGTYIEYLCVAMYLSNCFENNGLEVTILVNKRIRYEYIYIKYKTLQLISSYLMSLQNSILKRRTVFKVSACCGS